MARNPLRWMWCWVGLGLLAGGCAFSASEQADRAGTPAAYRDFLREHPRHPTSERARARLEELEFDRAAELHTLVAYKRFLAEFPDSPKAPDVKARLEALRFNGLRDEGKAAALRGFLLEHPDGAHAQEARDLLADLELEEARTATDPARLPRLLRERPDDPRTSELRTLWDDRAYAEALVGGAPRLLRYLSEFPAGAHRTAARVRLLSLELEGLLYSGDLEQAREVAGRSPLTPRIEQLPAWLERAETERALRASREQQVRSALPEFYLRSREDLVRSLSAPDPWDRWEAAEELGQHISVLALDPLLDAFRRGRNGLIRQRAFDSLAAILGALPPAVRDLEVARRLEHLSSTEAGPSAHLARAVLLDLGARSDEALPEYRRGFNPRLPDPVVLRRLSQLRRARGQHFSAAVAARQLALWARAEAEAADPGEPGLVILPVARQLCSAAVAARYAEQIIAQASSEPSEFPEDLEVFRSEAREARRWVEARLVDAELVLRTQRPHVPRCADRAVSSRLEAGRASRLLALEALAGVASRSARGVLALAAEKDPSPEIRARAQALLEGLVARSR